MNRFDEKTHTYYMGEKEVKSVTQLLPPPRFYCTPEQLERARMEGIDFHNRAKIFLYNRETFGDPELILLDEWLRENEKLIGDYVMHEIPLYSTRHRFGGTPDAVFTKAIIDWKRTYYNPLYMALQVAGYHVLAKENKIIKPTKKHLIVYKHSKGDKFISKNVWNDKAEDIFLSCVKKFHIEQALNMYLKN